MILTLKGRKGLEAINVTELTNPEERHPCGLLKASLEDFDFKGIARSQNSSASSLTSKDETCYASSIRPVMTGENFTELGFLYDGSCYRFKKGISNQEKIRLLRNLIEKGFVAHTSEDYEESTDEHAPPMKLSEPTPSPSVASATKTRSTLEPEAAEPDDPICCVSKSPLRSLLSLASTNSAVQTAPTAPESA